MPLYLTGLRRDGWHPSQGWLPALPHSPGNL